MFDFVNRKKGIVQVIMGLAVLPFLFWGVESYRNTDSEGYIAIVDGEEISRREYEQALRDHHERIRAMLGENFDNAMLDSFEVKNSVLESLIQQRLLRQEASSHGFVVLDSQLIKTIQEVPAFQKDNKFSKRQYEELLRNQGLTPTIFESRVRQELLLQQLLNGYSENGFAPRTVANKVRYLSEVLREINQSEFKPEHFLSQVKPEEEEINAYYEKNKAGLHLPERVRVEYVILSVDSIAKNETVSDELVNTYFTEHQDEFGQPEERKASHILISIPAEVSENERRSAWEKAEDILEQVRQNPEQFGEIAEKRSDDLGSAARGGDLGFFGRGVMVKSFEDKIFSMQLGEISEIVETNFGLHVIQLNEIKEEKRPNLEDVREQIENKLKMQRVGNIFGEIAEDFKNSLYEQADNLQVIAEKFQLPIQQSDWITRNTAGSSIFANEKLLTTIFSDEAISSRHNTEAIEIKPDTLISTRVIGHEPAAVQPLMAVRDQIVERLKKQMAEAMAIKRGEEGLARLKAGEEVNVIWDEAKQISYMQSQGLDHETLRAIFRSRTDNLPTYVGVANPDSGFNLIRINKVIDPEPAEQAKLDNFGKQLQQMITQEEVSSYLATLRTKYEVKIKQESF